MIGFDEQRPWLWNAMYFFSHPSDTSICLKEIVKYRLSYKVTINSISALYHFSSVIFLLLGGLLSKGSMGE